MTANKNASAKLRRRREWWAQPLQRRAQLADTHCARCQAPEPGHTIMAGLLSVSVREGQRWL